MSFRRMSVQLALGAVGAALVVQAAAAPGIVLSIGQRDDQTRLAFQFPQGATVTPLQNGTQLDLRFSRAGDLDAADLNVAPPRFVKSARVISRPGQPVVLRVTLEDGVRQRHFVDGRSVVVDLFRPEPDKPQTATATTAAEARGQARAVLVEEPGATRLTVRWSGPVRAAVFQRGQGAYLLFDGAGGIDLSGVARTGRRHRDVQTIAQQGVTGVRLALNGDAQVSARFENNAWSIVLAPRIERAAVAAVGREQGAGGGGSLTANFSRPGVVRWLQDPAIGDRFAAALLEGPPIGVDVRRATLEAALAPSAHGGLIEPRADDIEAAFDGGRLLVSRAGGLIASSVVRPGASVDPVQSLGAAGAMTPGAWRGEDDVLLRDQIAQAQRAAAAEGARPSGTAQARMALARLLFANDLAAETLGALRVAQLGQPQLALDPEFRLLRAAANVMMGRVKDAQADLSASGLARDPSAALWRGYAAALSQDWPEARRQLEAGRDAISSQSPTWRARFQLARAEAGLELGDVAGAESALAQGLSEARGRDLVARAQLLEGRLAMMRGDSETALARFDQLANAGDEAVAVRATLEAINARRAANTLDAAKAVDALEALRMRWRGDDLEIMTVASLGRAYGDIGRWRDGLAVMRATSERTTARSVAARRMRLDMGAMFERLFLDGEADKLEPIQALGLFYEFSDLTPFGPQGDRIIRSLAGRLVKLDLLEQAAELLQHQVDNRLEGVAKAQIALDLAGIYLSDGKTEKAFSALVNSRQPRLPEALMRERRIMEANVQLKMERYDAAAELVEKDRSEDAQRVRVEAHWRKREWKEALAALRPLLPPAGNDPLTDDQRKILLRAAIAAVNSEDAAMRLQLDRGYRSRMATTPDGDAFAVVAGEAGAGDARLRDAARAIAQTDLLDRFMTQMRARLTDQAPATPTAPPPA